MYHTIYIPDIQQSSLQLAEDKQFNNWSIRCFFEQFCERERNIDVLLLDYRSCLSWYIIGQHNFGTNFGNASAVVHRVVALTAEYFFSEVHRRHCSRVP